ncbi:N-acetyl sugar amidotransferase [Pseudomonadota bacterium]
MDTTDPEIVFDEKGVCNHCLTNDRLKEMLPSTKEQSDKMLADAIGQIKAYGKNKPYDCLMGLSGGVDSSYLAYLAKQHGLRPLVVHFDNGWNSELAVSNIRNIVTKLDFDLQTYVIDWEEFKDLQRSFLLSGVLDLELLSDQAIISTIFKLAKENNIKYILSGCNIATETHLPSSWNWMKYDAKNIRSIQKIYGTKKIKSFPLMGVFEYTLRQTLYKYKFVRLLDMAQFNKNEALELLQSEFGWREYGTKHGESIITKFYQNYILPHKFGIDKRRAHLSSMLCSGHITRDEALAEIEKPLYSPEELEIDIDYVAKKLDFSRKELDDILNAPAKSHLDYPSEYNRYTFVRWLKYKVYGERVAGLAS